MIPGILGTKVGMTHLFDENGRMVPVTVIQAGPVYVTQVKTKDSADGYDAVQVGFGAARENKLTFPKFGHLKKAGLTHNVRYIREFRLTSAADVVAGQTITAAEVLSEGEKITATSISKGRGFAGVVKRYHFKGQHMTHGFMTHRRPLSNGATGPQRVFKGKRGPGRMGTDTVTQKGLKVVKVDAERNLVLVSGSVAGAPGGLVILKKVLR